MGEVELFTLRLCQSDVYAPFLHGNITEKNFNPIQKKTILWKKN